MNVHDRTTEGVSFTRSVVRAELLGLPTPELLHRYNDTKDLAHLLMGLIAQHQQCTIADVYTLLDVTAPENRR
jgi:hypothetical protein